MYWRPFEHRSIRKQKHSINQAKTKQTITKNDTTRKTEFSLNKKRVTFVIVVNLVIRNCEILAGFCSFSAVCFVKCLKTAKGFRVNFRFQKKSFEVFCM